MAISTRLGPWLIGTVKNNSGTTPGTLRNTGAVVAVQSASITFTNILTAYNLFTLPAGSQIVQIYADITTAFTSSLTGPGITIQTAAGLQLVTFASVAQGRQIATYTAANLATIMNVGTTDLIIQGLGTAATGVLNGGAALLTVEYVVRNQDGTYVSAP